MQKFSEILTYIDAHLGGSQWFVFLLLGTGIFFTFYLKFPQFRYLKYSLKIVKGDLDEDDNKGDTSHFQALTTALSGTVGTGNIAGVALAIHLGGPAALFWMIMTAIFGMTTKFVEVSLSHKYRETAEDGTISGGPMYYMKNGLNMKWLAGLFAGATIFSAFGTGCLPQINSIANSAYTTFGLNKIVCGIVLSIVLSFIIIGGIKRIAKVTEKLIPFMAIIYFLGALAVIIYNIENVIPSMIAIIKDVFTGSAATGGFFGAGFAFAFNRGVNRGLFSNEAGQGSAPIAHAAAKANEPISEGLVALLEPFIDTIIICTVTGLVLLSSGVWNEKFENDFQMADMVVLEQVYDDTNTNDVEVVSNFINKRSSTAERFSGELNVKSGEIINQVTLLHARSIAEQVKIFNSDGTLFNGSIDIEQGKYSDSENVLFRGRSLIHSAPLTTEAFTRSWFGPWGRYIVTIGLLLFAFSTAISWSYYGDRAVTYLAGSKWVTPFRILYIIGFCLAAFVDTTIVWIFSGITIALMTIPNLFGILALRKEIKQDLEDFWDKYGHVLKNN